MAGLPGGSYTVNVQAVDAQDRRASVSRQVILESSAAVAPELVTSESGEAELLDTENGALLYWKYDGSFILRSTAGSQIKMDVPAGLTFPTNRQLTGGRVAMSAMPNASTNNVYFFDAAGNSRNASADAGAGIGFGVSPILKGSWLVWSSAGTGTIYNVETHAVTHLSPPAGTLFSGGFDFVSTPGNEQLLYVADGINNNPVFDIYRYRVANGMTDPITMDGVSVGWLQTDDVRVVWLRHAGVGVADLLVAPVGNPTASSVLSTSAAQVLLRDGLIAWIETGATSRALKVNDGTATTTLSSDVTVNLRSVASSNVLFFENDKLYVWSGAHGKRLLLEALPRQVVQRDNIAFIATGSNNTAIYRVSLQ